MTRAERLKIAALHEEVQGVLAELQERLDHWQNVACGTAFDAARYEYALEQIAQHPHSTYDFQPPNHSSGRQYEIGVTDGHRCAAQVAWKALGVPF